MRNKLGETVVRLGDHFLLVSEYDNKFLDAGRRQPLSPSPGSPTMANSNLLSAPIRQD